MKQSEIIELGIYTTLIQTERRVVTGITYDSMLVPTYIKGRPQAEPCDWWAELMEETGKPMGWLVEKTGAGVVTYLSSSGYPRSGQRWCTLLGFARWAKHRCIHLNWPMHTYQLSSINRRRGLR